MEYGRWRQLHSDMAMILRFWSELTFEYGVWQLGTVNFRYGNIFLDQYKEATIFPASSAINCINEFDLCPGANYSSIRCSIVGDSLRVQ